MEIWLIRHTTPKVEKGICYGQLDLDVNNDFDCEAKAIMEQLPSQKFCSVYTSPLQRCSMLAQKLFYQQTITQEERLKELNFGDWEGMAWNTIDKERLKEWGDNYLLQPPPNGESFSELMHRVDDFYSYLISKSYQRVALVTHSGIMRAFLTRFLHVPASRVFNLELSYGAIVRVKIHSDEYQQVKFIKG
ncbi:alpha-ribazole phosphatase [Carboxylicivirga taeanensis]|uniref:alpha-ribazole phosphatase n=1 Tax=Carboxylicivirga taeanensis TaxID=1416875 RepID=UPI003F6DC15F